MSATANPTARLENHVHRTLQARPDVERQTQGIDEDADRERDQRQPPAPRSRPVGNAVPPRPQARSGGRARSTSPSGSIATPNRQTATAMIASGTTSSRGTGSPSKTSDRPIRIGAEPAEHDAEQEREIAGAHPAGRAEGILARGQDGDHAKAAEHHAGPEIFRRADFHALPRCQARHRTHSGVQ